MSVGCVLCVVQVHVSRNGPIPCPEEAYSVCVRARMSLSVIMCNDKPLQLHRLGKSGQIKKAIIYSEAMLHTQCVLTLYVYIYHTTIYYGAWGGVVIKTLRY